MQYVLVIVPPEISQPNFFAEQSVRYPSHPMEALILGTQSADTKSKQVALDGVMEKLDKSPALSDVPVSLESYSRACCLCLRRHFHN